MNRRQGFSLFEILLVLIVMSVIVVGVIQFAKRQTERSSADIFGQRLFEYGAAASTFAREDTLLRVELVANDGVMTYEGLEHLKTRINPQTGQPYLPENFTLEVRPIVLGTFEDTNDNVQATYVKDEDVPPGAVIALLQEVQVGTVYLPKTANERDANNPNETGYKPAIDLAAEAVNVANNMRDQSGTARLFYALTTVPGASLDPYAHIIGVPRRTVGLEDDWLLVSGKNTMQGPIQFDEGNYAEDNTIKGVQAIRFKSNSDSGTNTVQDVDNIHFRSTNHQFNARFQIIHCYGTSGSQDYPIAPVGDLFCTSQGSRADKGCAVYIENHNNQPYYFMRRSSGDYEKCEVACLGLGDKIQFNSSANCRYIRN